MANKTIIQLTENTTPPAATSWLEIHREGAAESERVSIETLSNKVRAHLISYLPEASPYTTPSIAVNTPTKVLIPTTVKSSSDFAVVDIGGGDLRFQYQGSTTKEFRIGMTTGMRTGASNAIIKLRMYKNAAAEPGIYIIRKVGTETDTGALGIEGWFTLAPNDTISVWVETDTASTITFDGISINIWEEFLI